MSASRLVEASVEVLDVAPRSRLAETSVEVLGVFDPASRIGEVSVEVLELAPPSRTYQVFVRAGTEWVEAEEVRTRVPDAWHEDWSDQWGNAWGNAVVRVQVGGEWRLLYG